MYITAHHKYGALLSFWIFFFHRQLYQVSIDYQAPLWVWPSLCLSAKSSLPFPKLWIAPMVSVLNTVPSIRFSNIRTCRIQSRSALTPFSVSFASEFHSVEQHLLAFKKNFEVPGEKKKQLEVEKSHFRVYLIINLFSKFWFRFFDFLSNQTLLNFLLLQR